MSPAVKISASDYHPCSKHCVFVCQRLILLQQSHLHILPLHPHPTHAYSFTLWGLIVLPLPKDCKCSSGHSAHLSDCSHVDRITENTLHRELCFTVQEGARSYWDSKEINRIDSSLAEITLAFALYQILFCPKGCLPARQSYFKLYYSHVKEVRGSKQQSDGKAFKKY